MGALLSCAGTDVRKANVMSVNLRWVAVAAVVSVAGSALVTGAVAGAADDTASAVTADGVTATVTDTGAVLDNGRVSRAWSIGADGTVRTTAFGATGDASAVTPGADFSLTVDGLPTSSVLGWQLLDVTPQEPDARPGRPASGSGAALLFRYRLVTSAAPGLELDRLVVLHPGVSVVETQSTLRSDGPAARVSSYSLDELVLADPTAPAEVQAYNGGSDWRDDYRHESQPVGAFDAEGEVVRFGASRGVFLVSQRRGGSMSRVGRDASGRVWAGVDWARDLFDWGPLQTDPPNYNRLENPAYPVPVRARTLPPLGSLDLGTAYAGVYAGGPQEAAAAFAADFTGGAAPTYKRTVGLNSFHPWNHGPGLSDANLRSQVDIAADLGIETFMLDDQWQGGPGGESGDWQWDPERFPDSDGDGRPDFVDYLHGKGLQLGLWMSPVEFNTASTTYAAHPDWACAPVGDITAQVPDDAGLGVWDATNPQFQDYLIGVVDRLVQSVDVREFKFDFMAWVDCASSGGVHDYADYEAAFVDMVHRMQAHNPDVVFELDETNDQRSWPFESAEIGPSWFDNGHLHGSTAVAKLLHDVWSAAPWMPTWSMGVGLFDGTLKAPYDGVAGVDALMPLALLSHITFWTDLTKLTPEQRSETAWWISWWRAHRDSFGTTVYELTGADPIDGTSWAAFQPWNGRSGYVFAFRQPGGAPTTTLRLSGLDPRVTYKVTDVRTGRLVTVRTGAQLAAGLPVSAPAAGARVLAVQPAH
jgi:hypothetical protein